MEGERGGGIADGRFVNMQGAGLSTESGIPDYRSPNGSYSRGHKPLTHQEFVKSSLLRKRYWARSVFASQAFVQAKPNLGHQAIARLERAGYVNPGIITQNVDRLHQRGGSVNVLELHGHTDGVFCRSCAEEFSRPAFHKKILEANQNWFNQHMPDAGKDVDLRADGDAQLDSSDFKSLHVPPCPACGVGVLMPTIVFFGGSVPQSTRDKSFEMVEACNKIVVVGSSLSTWSAFRLIKNAVAAGKPLLVINAGETRADPLVSAKLDSVASGPLLWAVAEELGAL